LNIQIEFSVSFMV